MTKKIPLTQGKVAIVDDDMYDFLMQWQWSAHFNKGKWYAIRSDWTVSPKRVLKMHRVIMNAPDGVEVDHRNGDGLRNTRKNLRLCSRIQNIFNAGPQRRNKTGFKGVSPYGSGKKFRATISVRGKWSHIGVFATAEEAARAYDAEAIRCFGAFAWLNFPAIDQVYEQKKARGGSR